MTCEGDVFVCLFLKVAFSVWEKTQIILSASAACVSKLPIFIKIFHLKESRNFGIWKPGRFLNVSSTWACWTIFFFYLQNWNEKSGRYLGEPPESTGNLNARKCGGAAFIYKYLKINNNKENDNRARNSYVDGPPSNYIIYNLLGL